MSKPPFNITENMLNLVANISEKITRLEIDFDRTNNLHLRKKSKIKTIYSSLAIEANSLSEKQVLNVINGKKVLGNAREIKEVKNAYNAYMYLNKFNPYSIDDFLKLIII